MKYREVVIFSGHRFQVPEHIQRLDSKSTRAWQLRYGKWKTFSDHTADGSGAGAALALAIEELHSRIHRLPAPTGLRRSTNASKSTGLPVGISEPISRIRKGRRVPEYNFGVTIPCFGDKPTNVNVYIANPPVSYCGIPHTLLRTSSSVSPVALPFVSFRAPFRTL